MSLILKTAPAAEPVTLADMQAVMGVHDPADTLRDSVIESRITAARIMAEEFTRKAVISQTWELYASRFAPYFNLKMNLQSVVSLKYIDTDGVQQTLADDQYLVDTVHGCLYPAYGVTWPSVRSQHNAVVIEHVAGYGPNATDVPQNVLEAIKFLVAHWENYQPGIEGARITTIPYAVEQLLRPEKDFRGAF
jgi:uncharacterized phiE125 gp8 family phage protein